MNKEELIQSLKIKKGQTYIQQLPGQISNAIYQYGSSEDYQVFLFVDLSSCQDGSMGMIFTGSHLYFQLTKKGQIEYQDIQSLTIKKNRKQLFLTIQTSQESYTFSDAIFDIEQFGDILSQLSQQELVYDLSNHEKVLYNTSIIFDDIDNDEYEDLELTEQEQERFKALKKDLLDIYEIDQQTYQLEIELFCRRSLAFFDELGLDSDEIDELETISEEFNQKQNQAFKQAQSMASSLGLDMDSIKDKSPEELNAMVDDLCERVHISRSQLETLAQKFMKH